MKKRKSPLKFFANLIELGDLERKHYSFHDTYASMAKSNPQTRYDAEKGTVDYVIDDPFDFGSQPKAVSRDLLQEVRSEVEANTLKSRKRIYDLLTSGFKSEREWSYKQVMRDLDKWEGIIAREPLYIKYPFVATALSEIREYAAFYPPALPEQPPVLPNQTAARVLTVGFRYMYREPGLAPSKASMVTKRCLGNLFSELKDKLKLIDSATTLDDFRAVFSEKRISTPIKWVGTNGQLRCFIRAIEPKLAPEGSQRVRGKWDIAAACFVSREGNEFTSGKIMSTGITNQNVPLQKEIQAAAKLLL